MGTRPFKYVGDSRERHRQACKIWYDKQCKLGIKTYYKSNKEYRTKFRERILDLFGRSCVKCGYNTDIRALQLDHINRAQVPRNHTLRSGFGLYKAILDGKLPIEAFQLLCCNCNWLKKLDNNEHYPVATSEGSESRSATSA